MAATVLAGGALESHLAGLCTKHKIVITGDGSITKYDGAIAKARNDRVVEVYGAIDTKNVTAWGGLRNKAAHEPTGFDASTEQVRDMISGIRDFITRTT